MVNGVASKCAVQKRKAGILIPQCPPANNLEINGQADYFFFAHASHEIYKATYDLVFDNTNASMNRAFHNRRVTGDGILRITSRGAIRGMVKAGG